MNSEDIDMSRKRFRYITPFVGEAFFTVVKNGIADAARMLDAEFEFTGTEDADVEELCRMIRQTADEKYDGIAVSLVEEENMADAIAYAADQGVPVVAFNIGGTGKTRVLSNICQDAYKAGQTVGEKIRDNLGTGKVIFTLHDDVEVLRQRLDGILSMLPDDLDYKVMVSGNSPELACKNIQAEMEKEGNVTAVIGTGQSDTHGAGLALKAAGKGKFYVAGFDVCQDILQMVKEGVVDFTIDQQPYVQGFYPLLQLWQNASYGIVPSDINAGAAVIDSSNIDLVLDAAAKGCR